LRNGGGSSKMLRRKITKHIVIYTLLIVLIIPFLSFPGYWMLITSVKHQEDAISMPPQYVPRRITALAFVELLQRAEFVRYIFNSLVISIMTVVLSIAVACLSAFAFSRFRYRFISGVMLFFLLSQMLPSTLFLIPHFINMRRLGLLNTYPVLFISYTAIALPFCIWMLKSFFDTIPVEIDEAAVIDGASRIRLLTHILIPLAKPSIASVALYSFLLSWNEFVFGTTLMTKQEMKTLAVGITEFAGELLLKWNKIMASCVIACIPVIILFIFAQKSFVRGLTGGLKS
jgi:multiple sugar transport system permease protein